MQLIKTDDGSYTLIASGHQETYHSKFGALTESDQVYLRNSGVFQRLVEQRPTAILEIGFGTGFNFIHSAQHAVACNCPLSYTAYESAPIAKDLALELLTLNAPEHTRLCETAAGALERIASREDEVEISFDKQTRLRLIHADATRHEIPAKAYDAIYLDAFSTKNNPSLWHHTFLTKLRTAASDNAILATYCVNGSFRTALTDAGFKWQKLPGPKGKREVLIATPELIPG